MQRRFRKTSPGHVAEVWVDLGRLRYDVELYADGEFADRKRGWRQPDELEIYVEGQDTSALVHIEHAGKIWCTWPR